MQIAAEAEDVGRIKSSLLFTAMGLAEGIVWWLIDPFGQDLGTARWGISFAAATTGALLVGRFTWTSREIPRWAAVVAVLGIVIGLVTLSVWGHLPEAGAEFEGDEQRVVAWVLGAFAFLYIVTPFSEIFQRTGQLRFPYTHLFDHSWNNFFIGLVAAGFTAAVWAVLGVWAALFNLVEISLFQDLFTSKPFAYLCTFTVFGYGLAVGRSSEEVIAALRRITLMAGRTLLPLISLVALLFALTLPFTGLGPLWATRSATLLVLVLLTLMAVFLNAVFEDGSREAPYPWIARIVIEAATCIMPLYAAIALYGTSLRVTQYGLTPQRVYALVFGAIAGVYALGYATAVIWRRTPWIGLLKSVNVGAALVVAAAAVLIQLWPLDPLRLSAENQRRRLERRAVAVDDFDFGTLRFRLGHYGWAELHRLEGLQAHPQIERILGAIESVRAAPNFWATQGRKPVADLGAVRFRTLPLGSDVPTAVLKAMGRDRTDLGSGMCQAEDDCLVLAADIDGDGKRDFCILGGFRWFYSACYMQTDTDGWVSIGSLAYRGDGTRPSKEQIEAWYWNRATLPARQSPYRDLILPEGFLQVVPKGFVMPVD